MRPGLRRRARGGPDEARAPRRRPWTGSLHVWVLVSFAVAQPLYDLLAIQAGFFIFHNAGRAEILGLVLVLSGLLPLVLVGAERLAGLIVARHPGYTSAMRLVGPGGAAGAAHPGRAALPP